MILVVGDVVDDIGVRLLEPVALRSDTRARIRTVPGGSAANTAAWIGESGTPVRFFGKVGRDGLERHSAALREHGVDPVLAVDPLLPTAKIIVVLEEDADRTMYVDRGANGSLKPADIPDGLFDGVDWLHISGYTLLDPATRPLALYLLAKAADAKIGRSVDPGSAAYLKQAGAETFLGWVDGVDLLFPNLDEARVLVQATGPWVDFAKLADRFDHVVVKLGAMGAAYLSGDVREQVTAARVEVVDTTGAGDSFAAGFLSSWVKQRDPAAALSAGTAVAQRCIQLPGARPAASGD